MGGKRRSDDDHDVGDSKPGTTGDRRPERDEVASPMARIHDRRAGDLLSEQETRAFLDDHDASGETDADDGEERDGYDEWGIPTGIGDDS